MRVGLHIILAVDTRPQEPMIVDGRGRLDVENERIFRAPTRERRGY